MAIQSSINSLLGTAQSAMAIKKVVEGQEAQVEEQKKTRAEAEATKNLVQQQQEREEKLNRANIATGYREELNPLEEEERKTRLQLENISQVENELSNRPLRDKTGFGRYIVTRGQLDDAQKAYKTATERLKQFKDNPANIVKQKYASGEIKDFASYQEELAKVQQQEFVKSLSRLNAVEARTYGYYVPSTEEIVDAGGLYAAQDGARRVDELSEIIHEAMQAQADAQADEADAKENNK